MLFINSCLRQGKVLQPLFKVLEWVWKGQDLPHEGTRKQRAKAANGFFVTDFSSRAAEDKQFLASSQGTCSGPGNPSSNFSGVIPKGAVG